MSSPMMKRMFGCVSCAAASAGDRENTPIAAKNQRNPRPFRITEFSFDQSAFEHEISVDRDDATTDFFLTIVVLSALVTQSVPKGNITRREELEECVFRKRVLRICVLRFPHS